MVTPLIYTIHHRKGGCGKTTIAQHLGRAWSERVKTLLVDFDVQANLSAVFGKSFPKQSVGDLLRLHMEDKPLRFDGFLKINESLDILPASMDLFNCLSLIENYGGDRGKLLRDLLKRLMTAEYGRIIIDTNPSDSWLSRNALVAADHIIVPISCEAFAIDGLAGLQYTLDELSRFERRPVFISHLVPTMIDGRKREQHTYEKGLRDRFQDLVTRSNIRICSKIPRAQTRNLSSFDIGGSCRSTADFRDLANELFEGLA